MRYSTHSMAPTVATVQTTRSITSNNSEHAEITQIATGLEKLENKKLASQRFVPSETKSETLSKLALGAKLERALDRRMGSQDAVMRVKKAPAAEKMSEKVEIAA